MADDPRRGVPSVDAVLAHLKDRTEPHHLVVAAVRDAAASARDSLTQGSEPPSADLLAATVAAKLDALSRPALRKVINASGVVLQTNLGRAPLSERALSAMAAVAAASNLEYDLESGRRGSRHEHVRDILRAVTGAADGIAVNNNAAALFMVLQAFCAGREVIVSRGQSVEIGGGFRIPDVLRQSGARLVDVGTTNRTYVRDYEEAIGPDTAAILRVHTSNFQVTGFTTEPAARELAGLAHQHGLLCLDDLGSGCLIETADYGLQHEPTVQESLEAGVDLAMFSGDKLLGGPQAGLIVGREDLIAGLRRHPLARALRLDKMAIAGLNATLLSYLLGREREEIPVWRMLSQDLREVRRRARAWARAAGEAGGVVAGTTMVGGGSLPGQGVPTVCASIRAPWGPDETARRLRNGRVAVIGRVTGEACLLDPRTVSPSEDAEVAALVAGMFPS
jgi:L-seryl-tRNA(Ser) seleniumtransferase